jgi:FHA domain-containing protein
MTQTGSPGAPLPEVVVQLLDAAHGRPVQTWRFVGKQDISIGRFPERDVEISDPYVSRLHAELCFRDGRWVLLSRGRNGVVVNHQPITELAIDGAVAFRLGPSGPSLRFYVAAEEKSSLHTLCFDTEQIPTFTVDDSRLRQDVGEIAGGDYFQKLQQQAQSLRSRRRS